MTIETYTNPEGLWFYSTSPEFLQLLKEAITPLENPDQRVEDRLFPSPSKDPKESELLEDWKGLVVPDLLEQFQRAQTTVKFDLKRANKHPKKRLLIPTNHTDAWLNTLNQSRLALSSLHNLTEKELTTPLPHLPETLQPTILKIHLFGLLQEWIIDYTENTTKTP